MIPPIWPGPGSADTELGVLMGPEVGPGKAEVYTRVQSCTQASHGLSVHQSLAQLGEDACGCSAACVPWPRSDEARTAGDRAVQARSDQAEG
jgi:hypothetical protein